MFKEYFANNGWSNVRSQLVLNYTITGRKGTVFMHAEYPKLVKKDAEYVAQKLVEAKQIYESLNVGSQRTTIVQDNTSVMSAANVVLHSKNKEEMGYLTKIGCVLHSHSLLFKDMLKIGPTKNAADTAVLIAKGFKNRTRPRNLVDDKQLPLNMKRTPAPLPAETRMGSRFITVCWVLKNKLLVIRHLRPCYSFGTIVLTLVTFQILFCGRTKLQRAVRSVGGTSGVVAFLSCKMF